MIMIPSARWLLWQLLVTSRPVRAFRVLFGAE